MHAAPEPRKRSTRQAWRTHAQRTLAMLSPPPGFFGDVLTSSSGRFSRAICRRLGDSFNTVMTPLREDTAFQQPSKYVQAALVPAATTLSVTAEEASGRILQQDGAHRAI
jgi:hypothetical protein